jgi:hypothetical protein
MCKSCAGSEQAMAGRFTARFENVGAQMGEASTFRIEVKAEMKWPTNRD